METLPDEVLLEVFDHYRLSSGNDWSHPRGWYRLVHVCQRWRLTVLASSLRLHLRLRCTFKKQVEDMITYSPPFPLILNYNPSDGKTWTTQDEDGALFALQHLERAHEITLIAPETILTKLVVAMTCMAPLLEYLELKSEAAELVLPENFLDGGAPRTRHLRLAGVALRTLRPLPSFSTTLVNLSLERIPGPAYFSPENLVQHIRPMPQLRTLSIGFLSTTPRPPPLPPHPIPRVELPALARFEYRGVSAWSETFLAKVRTPRLNYIHTTLFNQLTLSMWHISQFFHSVETLRPNRARIKFSEKYVDVTMTAQPHPYQLADAILRVPCARFDFQVAAVAQICSALHAILLSVEALTLTFHGRELPKEWQNEVNTALWRDLLEPFRHVKTLAAGAALGTELGRTLAQSEEGDGPVAELLPELLTIALRWEDQRVFAAASAALGPFIDVRGRSSRPVKVKPLWGLT